MLKARDNPFSSDRIERRITFDPAWCETSWPQILQRWQSLDYRAAVVGAHGSGKTTFLRALEQRLDVPVAHFFLNDEQPALSPSEWQRLERSVDAGTTIFLDGAERLGWRAWRQFELTVGSARAIVTRHRSARWPTLLETRASSKLLAHLIGELSAAPLRPGEIEQLFDRHHGNIREALWECYDRAAKDDSLRMVHFQRSQPSS